MIRETSAGVELDVRVIPRANRTEIGGTRDGALIIRLSAPPVDDAANDALVALLSGILAVPRRAVRIVSGARGRRKRVEVDGVTPAVAADRLRLDRL